MYYSDSTYRVIDHNFEGGQANNALMFLNNCITFHDLRQLFTILRLMQFENLLKFVELVLTSRTYSVDCSLAFYRNDIAKFQLCVDARYDGGGP